MTRQRSRGFLLLPVLLLLSMVAGAAYLTLREGHLSVAGELRQGDADKARAAAEAGLHRVIHEAHSKGCIGEYPTQSKPIRDAAFDGASYSAYASKKDSSPLNLTSDGSYGGARVTLTRDKVVMHRATAQIIVLQPGAVGQDTSLRKGSSSSDPDATTLSVQPNASEAVMAFDLSAIPEGSHISSAQLSVRIIDLQGSGMVGLHRIQSAWAETATAANRSNNTAWVQEMGDAHPAAVASAQASPLGWMAWSITDLVDGWVKGRWPNHGLLLRGLKLQSLNIASSDYPSAGLRPRLVVTFHPPCGWDLPQQKQTLIPVADATLSEASPDLNDSATGTFRLLNGSKDLHVVLRFDTSTIAKDRTITKATLRLTFAGLSSNTATPKAIEIYARQNNESWDEATVTWKRRSTSQSWDMEGAYVRSLDARQERRVDLPKDSIAQRVVEFDAKAWVNTWIDPEESNDGVLLRLSDSDDITLIFGSRESLTMPPELVIEYE